MSKEVFDIMKKEEKTKLTCEKIVRAAIVEFGTKSYEAASLNTICSENQISKGLIYHNFKNKDELYLVCVKECYQAMMLHQQKIKPAFSSAKKNLEELLRARQEFFEKYPHYAQIFFNSLLQPPQHLKEELKELRKGYDTYVRKRYAELLNELPLRKGISRDKAVEYLMIFQEMYNGYFRELSFAHENIHTLIAAHENKISELLDVMLYGIVSEEEERC